MEHFFIITNKHKDPDLKMTKYIQNYLEEKGKVCEIQIKDRNVLEGEQYTDSANISEDVDMILVLGGDGTMLQAARDTMSRRVPLLGVNMGTLGYLAEVEENNIKSALDQLINDDFSIEERMMLVGRIYKNGGYLPEEYALNDITLTRKGSLQIIRFAVEVNGQLLSEYGADGIIVATPTGSTGYNLSAGGPIVEPPAKLLLLTPVCPHTLHSRSIVLSAADRISISVAENRDGRAQTVEASIDGGHHVELSAGDRIEIGKAQRVVRIVKLKEISFLETLHKKMNE